MSFDVIVVGAGSAGAVVARRLVDQGASVLVLEAGGIDTNPIIHDTSRVHELWFGDEDWGYRTVPQHDAADRQVHWPRGKVLGGSSSLNGMVWIRGWQGDYDAWAYMGNEGWGWDDVLPLFKRSEDFQGPPSDLRGTGGPMHLLTDFEHHPVNEAFVAAAVQAGVPFNPDHNGAELDGVGWTELCVRDGHRLSTQGAYLAPVGAAENLTVWPNTPARRLVFEGTRCVGVEVLRDGQVEVVRAASEVVVSAGTIESPKLLMLSGIGGEAELRSHGIDVLHDLPGVGGNLHDHTLAPFIWSSSRPLPPPIPGIVPQHAHLFARSRPGLVSPDLQPLCFHTPLYEDWMQGPEDAFTILPGHIRPASRGRISLASADPSDAPRMDPRYLSASSDLDALMAAAELVREIAQQDAFADFAPEELYPGPGVVGEELRDYFRRTVLTYHHQAGTCKMGVDDEAVVDPQLRVRGVEGVRVADCSIMPMVTSGNTVAPAIMIGEKCADLVGAALGSTTAAAAA